MQQRLSSQLRVGSGSALGANLLAVNLVDATASDPGWTKGATLIDALPLSPPLTQTWHVLAWSFTFNGAFQRPNASPSYGKLGAPWAGLLTQAVTPTQTASNKPWVNPMQPLPIDLSTFQKVWDGSADAMFPSDPQVAAGSTVTDGASLNLPSPIIVDPGRPLGFGVWLTPSLAANTLLEIAAASVSIIYDDGMGS